MNIDFLGGAIFALMIALGVIGFVFGISSYMSIQTLHKRIEYLENTLKRLKSEV